MIFEVGAVAALHLLGGREFVQVDWRNLSDWLDSTPVEDVIAAGLRLVTLGIGYWLLFSTIAYLIASLSQRSAGIRATRWMTLPSIRRLVSRSVALSIAASSIAVPIGPAMADLALGPRATVVLEVGPDGVPHLHGTEHPTEEDSADEGDVEDEVLLPPHLRSPDEPVDGPVVETEAAPALDSTATHVHKVVRGDHLWSIACQHLEAVSGRTNLSEHEIAPYWVQVIEANRSNIRSGDPDFIYPGERIVLPPVRG